MSDVDTRCDALSGDTSADAEARQIAIWRSMSPTERAALFAGASRAVRTLALAGLRARHPGASEAELVARYVQLTLGTELAARVYPDVRLDPAGRD